MIQPVESLEITVLVANGADSCRPIPGLLKPRWPAHGGGG